VCVTASERQHLYELLKGFKVAILVTRAGASGMHARPLAIADVPADGELVFATSSSSGKVAEIAADANVLVTFQAQSHCVCLSGRARVLQDRALIRQLWSEAWRIFYPGGSDDPCLCLIAVEPSEGEYWDNAGLQSLKYLFRGAKAYLSGERLTTDAAHEHAKVDLK
jgi:general stress protein 26